MYGIFILDCGYNMNNGDAICLVTKWNDTEEFYALQVKHKGVLAYDEHLGHDWAYARDCFASELAAA